MAVPNAPAPVAQTSQGLGKALWLREEFKKPPNKRHPSLRSLKDPQDFQVVGPQIFEQMAANDPNFASHWESVASGEAPQSQTSLPKLPKKYREMPNAPTGSPAEFDPVSGQLSRAGKSPRANQTFKDMADQLTSRRNAATQAVADTKAAQINDVPGTVDRSIAARDNQLAQDGVTDMGGGNMAMRNKYGAGFVTTGNAPRALGSKPGAVRDENGVVDMKASVAGNTIVNTPGNPEALPTRAESMQDIEKNIALMAPGAVERRAADRNAIVASTQKRVNANVAAAQPQPQQPAGPASLLSPQANQALSTAGNAIKSATAALPGVMKAIAPAAASLATGSPIAGALTNIALNPPQVSNTMPPAPFIPQAPKKKPVQ